MPPSQGRRLIAPEAMVAHEQHRAMVRQVLGTQQAGAVVAGREGRAGLGETEDRAAQGVLCGIHEP